MNYIYKITNKITNKHYIGQTTKTVDERWHQHINEANNKNSIKDTALYRSMRKYGVNNFYIETIEEVEDDVSLDEREQYWIKFYNSYGQPYGYNETIGGNLFSKDINPMKLPEIKQKISDHMKENSYWKSEKHRELQRIKWTGECNPAKKLENRLKLSERVKGNNNPACRPEVKEKIRLKAIGRLPSEETRKKMSENNSRYWKDKKIPQYMIDAMAKARSIKLKGINNPAAKPFMAINENDNIIKEFGVYTEAADYILNSKLIELVKPPIKGKNKGVITKNFLIGKIRDSIINEELFCGYKWVRIDKV